MVLREPKTPLTHICVAWFAGGKPVIKKSDIINERMPTSSTSETAATLMMVFIA